MQNLSRIYLLIFLLIGITNIMHVALGQDVEKYGNEWINYSNTYIRLGVEKQGVQRIKLASLPSSFSKEGLGKFQLWYRGKEVSILAVTDTEILFYGVPNDGATDSLVYRPSTARLNPYSNLFSDLGYYFLTTADTAHRAELIDAKDHSGTQERFHYQTDVVKFTNQFAGTTFNEALSLNNSFYDSGNSWTGATIAGPGAVYPPNITTTQLLQKIQLNNWVDHPSIRPSVELLINGLQEGQHNVQLYAGKSAVGENLRKISATPFTGWGGIKSKFDLAAEDITEAGLSNFKLESTTTSNRDWFGLSYYKVTYPQSLDMTGKSTFIINLPSSSHSRTRVNITNVPALARVYDISDIHNPKILQGQIVGNDLSLSVQRTEGKPLKLLIDAEQEPLTIADKNINLTNFQPMHSVPVITNTDSAINPSSYDFLIITTNTLKDGAISYSNYRGSEAGGMNKTLVMDIRNIYDQFNYGEPSPIAIRSFINYMLKNGVRSKHNLLLLGYSVSMPIRLVKEMPEEIPTFGDPGSDLLLISGLKGSSPDVPAIPIGRVNAFSSQDILNYLEKVKSFESENDLSWQKKVLHLNGGHSVAEINQLKGILSNLSPLVESGQFGGVVKPFVKTSTTEVEKVNITQDVNEGVGMITYFGHGSQTITDLDMGYVTEAGRGYQNKNKYPLMYFNGCGVGNIFTSRTTQMLSSNWLLTPNRGAIAIIANSYKSYVSSSAQHLDVLYRSLFNNESDLSIGQVLKKVAEEVVVKNPGSYEIANLHQSNLLGDPSLKLMSFNKADYFVKNDTGIFINSVNEGANIGVSDSVKVSIVISNGGKYDKSKNLEVELELRYRNGSTEIKQASISPVAFQDTLTFAILNRKNIQSVTVMLDPANKINEKNKDNNYSELLVDWDIAKNEKKYPTGNNVDVVPPLLDVKFNGNLAENSRKFNSPPIITMLLSDDRILDVDTSRVSVFIKPCKDAECDFKQVSYKQGMLSVKRYSNRGLEVTYNTGSLGFGFYEIRIIANDNAGNTASGQYVVGFEIYNSEIKGTSVIVSPNPASDYIHFKADVHGVEFLERVTCEIYNANGALVHKNNVDVTKNQNPINWFWYPNVVSGSYFYLITLIKKDNDLETLQGKITIVR